MEDYNAISTPEIVRLLGNRFKSYRIWAQMTQNDVSKHSGVSKTTIYKFENGTATNISMGTFLLLMKAIGAIGYIDNFLPELPPSPYHTTKKNSIPQRIRHK